MRIRNAHLKTEIMEKVTLQQAIDQVKSIMNNTNDLHVVSYPAHAVLTLLESIEQPAAKLSDSQKGAMIESIVCWLEEEFNDFVDYDSAEFRLRHNELLLEGVGMDEHHVRRSVECLVSDTIVYEIEHNQND